jgi:hypothetical protein
VRTFEYLIGKAKHFDWRPAAYGIVVPGAVAAGSEQLFIGRAPYKGSTSVGRIQPSRKCLYISYEGKEVSLTSYEVLVWTKGEEDGGTKKRKKKKRKKRKMKSLSLSSDSSDSDWSDCCSIL